MKESIRKRIFKRDHGICWHCGTDENVTIHHRTNRGMGGSKNLDMPSNLVVMCSEFNFLMEADLAAFRLAKKRGWKVSKYQRAAEVEIQNHEGRTFLLDDMFRRWEKIGNREDGGSPTQE